MTKQAFLALLFMGVLWLTLVAGGPVRAQPLPAAPTTVALWAFNETGGTIAHDTSPYGNDGTVYGGTWMAGRSLFFDGSGDFVQIPAAGEPPPGQAGLLSQGTISLRFRLNSFPPVGEIQPLFLYGSDSGSANRVIIEVGHNALYGVDKLYFTAGGSDAEPAQCFDSGLHPIQLNRWHHFVAVVGPGFNTGYLDGVEMVGRHYNYGDRFTSVFLSAVTDADVLAFGWARYGEAAQVNWFDGMIDDIRIFRQPLTAAQVQALYRSLPLAGE